jgi:NurA-like 5'-3' nuclease
MDDYLLLLFLNELKRQCSFAEVSYNEIQYFYNLRDEKRNRLWFSLELFLIATAKISIIFRPQNKYKKRGEELSNILSVNETAAFHTRRPRNYLEHFDEHLDDWYTTSTHHNLIDSSIINSNSIIGPIDYLRIFLTDKFAFAFLKDEYEIKPIYESVIELSKKVDIELENVKRRLMPKVP